MPGIAPANSAMVGARSLLSTKCETDCAVESPGVRIYRGTRIDSSYTWVFLIRRCCPKRYPLSDVKISTVLFNSPFCARAATTLPTRSSIARIASSLPRYPLWRTAIFWELSCGNLFWSQAGLSLISGSLNEGGLGRAIVLAVPWWRGADLIVYLSSSSKWGAPGVMNRRTAWYHW